MRTLRDCFESRKDTSQFVEMAEQAVGLGLAAVPHAIDNYEKAWHPIKRKAKQLPVVRSRYSNGDESYDRRTIYEEDDYTKTPEERGLVLRKRSEVHSDEEIVEAVPRRARRRPGMERRTSSLDRGDYGRHGGHGDRRVGAYRGRRSTSDSEGSVPPRSRVSRRGRGKSTGGRSKRSSSNSSSDLGSSTDDLKKERHVKHMKYVTGALAAVATIHAGAKVYSSIEAHDKRIQQVQAGELSPEESRKKRNTSRWQDAAAIGIAALGIKGALGEWNEVQEKTKEHKEAMERHRERHQRRLERERRSRQAYQQGRDSKRDRG